MNRTVALGIAVVTCAAFVLAALSATAPALPTSPPHAWVVLAGEPGDQSYVDSARAGVARANASKRIRVEEFAPSDGDRLETRLRDRDDLPGLVEVQDSGAWPGAVERWADAHPGMRFLVIDAVVPARSNVRSVRISADGVSFLAGALAAAGAGGRPVAVIAGMPSPVMAQFVRGFSDGAAAEVPETRVDVRYISKGVDGFSDPERGRAGAEALYQNGTAVIYAACGGSSTGVIDAAGRAPGRFVVGVDRDQADLGPTVVLGSAVKRVDRVVEEALLAYADGAFTPGDTVIGLDANATDLVLNPQFEGLAPVLERHRASAGERDR